MVLVWYIMLNICLLLLSLVIKGMFVLMGYCLLIKENVWWMVFNMLRVRIFIFNKLRVFILFLFYWIIVCVFIVVFFIGIRLYRGLVLIIKLFMCCDKCWGVFNSVLVKLISCCICFFLGFNLRFVNWDF